MEKHPYIRGIKKQLEEVKKEGLKRGLFPEARHKGIVWYV